MIVILCDSWEEACDSYGIFLDFLENYDPFKVWIQYDVCNCIYLNSLLLCPPLPEDYYIFVPYQIQNFDSLRFDVAKNDVVDSGSFFDNLYSIEEDLTQDKGLFY